MDDFNVEFINSQIIDDEVHEVKTTAADTQLNVRVMKSFITNRLETLTNSSTSVFLCQHINCAE